jgi:hypothetical protein
VAEKQTGSPVQEKTRSHRGFGKFRLMLEELGGQQLIKAFKDYAVTGNRKYYEKAQHLILNGANVNAVDKKGNTVLALVRSWRVDPPVLLESPRTGLLESQPALKAEYDEENGSRRDEYFFKCLDRDLFIGLLTSYGAK